MRDISDTPEINGNKPNDTEKARNLSCSPMPISSDTSAELRTNPDFRTDKW